MRITAHIWVIIGLMLVAGAAAAQQASYIQINNGQIMTNAGQRFQVVTQFGNRSQETFEDVIVACFWPDELGSVGRIYAGPFQTTDFATDGSTNVVAGNVDLVEVADQDLVFGFVLEGVDLRPGQNYNFSFDVHTASAGVTGEVSCVLQEGFVRLSDTRTTVVVR